MSNTTFTLEINELMRDTRYECSVAAGTRVGPGPHSVSVLFTTPVGTFGRGGLRKKLKVHVVLLWVWLSHP